MKRLMIQNMLTAHSSVSTPSTASGCSAATCSRIMTVLVNRLVNYGSNNVLQTTATSASSPVQHCPRLQHSRAHAQRDI
jgi:uncharacterized protein YerC